MNAASAIREGSTDEILAALRRSGLVPDGCELRFIALTGGVASDIWKVDGAGEPFVVKRALPTLRVAAEWHVPVSRNSSEVGWFRAAARVASDAVPEILMHDPDSGLFAMRYFPPARYPVWKNELRDGRVDVDFAAAVGRTVARIHTATANDEKLAREFDNDAIFHAIRLEPYLEATGGRHPALSERLFALSADTLGRHVALVHGDVSPKNILVGPQGPVFLDAECAWYGDPAFDLAFCLNHMLLKCVWNRPASPRFLEAFTALSSAYLNEAAFEPVRGLESRTAKLLPALFLARVDGKSPVEYITCDADRELVRAAAIPLVLNPPERLWAIRDAWAATLKIR